jgi:glutamate carboxypeptidase
MRNITMVAVGLILSSGAAAQTSQVEQQMAVFVDQNSAEAIAFLEQVVNINSGSLNFEGVRAVGDVLRTEFDELGFTTQWIDGSGFGRAGHLVATRDGTGPRLLLIGHLDTVFEKDSPFQAYRETGDSMAAGPGVVDMKGGDVIILYALKALAQAGVLYDLSITVVMTGDEERSGRPLSLARKALIDAAEAADIAIGFENGDSDPRTAVISRRSSSSWQLTVTGRPAHSSQIFRESVGAGSIYETSRILDGFYRELAEEQYLTFNPGLILGGTDVDYDASQARGTAFGKNNVVAERTVVSGDIRALSPEQLERAKAKMRTVAEHHLPHTTSELTFRDSYPPLAPTPGNKRLLATFDRVSRDLGFGPVAAVDPRSAGAADISFTAGYVEMAMDGLGPGGGDDHTVDEFIDLRTLSLQTKRAALLLYRLGKGELVN